MAVAPGTLVGAGEAAERGGGAVGGGAAFVDAGDGRGVVAEVFERGVGRVFHGAHEVQLG